MKRNSKVDTFLGIPICIDVRMPANRIELRRVRDEDLGILREVVTRPKRRRKRRAKR